MAGDSVSLPTNVAHSDTVSRIQQGQATDQQAGEKLAKKLAEPGDDDAALLKNLSETERARLRKERREERRKQQRQQKRDAARERPDDDPRGGSIDVKV
ncbi:MAG TPA: hypothetical protein VKA86_10250 [Candidatus Krumholzibacteria bacterium]|nr:hypothetical protein [Candidatus Krumholzibacteria bacterium]